MDNFTVFNFNNFQCPNWQWEWQQSAYFNPQPPPVFNFNFDFSFNLPTMNNFPWLDAFTPSYYSGYTNYTSYISNSKSSNSSWNSNSSGSSFRYLSKESALARANSSSYLERLSGGANWRVCSNSFINDIPFAGKGINRFLDKLTSEIGTELVVTSALGTQNSPHVKNGGHYDEKNPKLDFGGGLSHSSANDLANKLRATGYFSRVAVESDGSTSHLDVRIKPEVLAGFA